MSSIRALTQEARVCLDRSQSTAQPVVREVMLRKAAKLIERAEVLSRLGVSEFPDVFVNAILAKRSGVIVECPTVTREEFIASRDARKTQCV